MRDAENPADLAARIPEIYQEKALAFDRLRPKGLHERTWLDRFLDHLPEGGRILDVGCGAGDPIARYFSSRGHRVTGIDVASAMLEIARARFPLGDWRLADMCRMELGELFDGAIAWDSFFHLTPERQRTALSRISAHLRPGGVFLASVGPSEGEAVGEVDGAAVYHSSLSPEGYAAALKEVGMELITLVTEDPDCDFRSLLLARKP